MTRTLVLLGLLLGGCAESYDDVLCGGRFKRAYVMHSVRDGDRIICCFSGLPHCYEESADFTAREAIAKARRAFLAEAAK